MKALASYIMRGPLQATAFVSICAILSLILPFVNYFSGAALALVTLRQGLNPGFIVLVISSVVFAIFTFFVPAVPQMPIAVFGFIGLLVMVWVLAAVLRHWRSMATALIVAGAFGFAFIAVVYITTDPALMWQQITAEFFKPVLEQADEESRALLSQQIMEAAHMVTGFFAAGIVLNCAICLLLGRYWQALLYNPGGFRQEFHGLRFGNAFAIFTAVVGAASFIPLGKAGVAAADLFSVLLMLYFMQGLAIAHATVFMKKLNIGFLVALYVLSIFLLKLIAVVGFIDTWMNFRQKVQASLNNKS